MKKITGLLLCMMLTGCLGTSPVIKAPKWPDAPKELLEACPNLSELQETTELSEIATVVVKNYSEYYVCKAKSDGWAEWYKLQKDIYENATK